MLNRSAIRRLCLPGLTLLACLLLGAPGLTQDTNPPPPKPVTLETDPVAAARLFAMPGIAAETRTALGLIQAGNFSAAARILDRSITRFPGLEDLRPIRAALAMLQNDPATAFEHIAAAADLGLDVGAVTSDPIMAPLLKDADLGPRLADLINAPAPEPVPTPQPLTIAAGQAPVTSKNTTWNPATEQLQPLFTFPADPAGAVLPPKPKTAAYEILREHMRRGRAAGNHGDLYDNRDRQHSALKPAAHPQLTHVTYSDTARKAGVDYGLAGMFLFDRPTLGNSSTAITGGDYWRSLPRHALTLADGTGPLRLWQAASANQLYMYPAHKDFTEENGDVFPANTPWLLISRGSSYSDKPFMEAVAMILAAFRQDTKERLIAENLIVPTVQMVFRRSLQNVRSRESYFSGDAHPVVFAGHQINLARMVSLANAIKPDDIPAEVRIAVESEETGTEGLDFFGQGLSEQLFDTPGAIARIWRSKTGRRSMVVSAKDSRDANGNPLTFHWRLLQGDPDRVKIEPLEDGQKARITLDWHDPFEISEDVPLTTSRVDIGVFAHNGTHDSAPAILSWYFPPHETRTFEPGPDGAPRVTSIDYADPAKAETYADPQLLPRADWRDDYTYAPDGTLLGWTRHRARRSDDFTAAGKRILTRHADESPASTDPVAYVLRRDEKGLLRVEEISG